MSDVCIVNVPFVYQFCDEVCVWRALKNVNALLFNFLLFEILFGLLFYVFVSIFPIKMSTHFIQLGWCQKSSIFLSSIKFADKILFMASLNCSTINKSIELMFPRTNRGNFQQNSMFPYLFNCVDGARVTDWFHLDFNGNRNG